ncbi:hypothetical protein N7495_000734 [Penicillium taxi]|uniref:uncharacterized protein n=1 Tax=Penicillium taxi TaxID=168475 RepID=UPI0025451D50|nr:uncharacterized protein N7495_000734 [Penicillium taxi]KAJ5908052.1 hypothetical protein N7495_000734 [Penicillium taxi]
MEAQDEDVLEYFFGMLPPTTIVSVTPIAVSKDDANKRQTLDAHAIIIGDRGDRGGDRGARPERPERSERRRSRSPHYGSRGQRRETEVNSYSSSRDYRAREREDRYSSTRQDDREWDRERGDRGDRGDRRDRGGDRTGDRTGERGGDRAGDRTGDRTGDRGDRRRNFDRRDLFDDRNRRGGDRDRNDRPERPERPERSDRGGPSAAGADSRRERRRSATPPRPKEPTPDLTDAESILARQRRLTQWDMKPPGYENVTAEQAKLSGMFPLPGAPRQQPMDPSRLQAFMNPPAGGTAENTALKLSNARQSKRLFVHKIPADIKGDAIISFFNQNLNGLNVIESDDPCISAQVSDDGEYALLEFKSPNDATVALALDGVTMSDDINANEGLEVRRPKDYIVPDLSTENVYQEGVLLNEVPDSPNKICVTNIPAYIPDEAVVMLLKSFGELKSFILAKDKYTEESRGIAFCEYADPAATPIAVEGLNGMELGDRNLKVTRASVGTTQASGLEMGVNAMSMFAKTTSSDIGTGRVLQLLNMVTVDELIDNNDYEEIKEDVGEECEKYGTVLGVKIPRPIGSNRQVPGIGKIFVKFDKDESATAALKALAGRKFSDRTVVVSYFNEENYDVDAW